jgi:phosphopantetheinyl transferase (holo-ACP synthase)
MIVSVGVDMVEVERIRKALENSRIGQRFRARVFTQKENTKAMPAVLRPRKRS